MPFVTIRFSPKGLAFIRQLLATLTAAWTCVGHGLLTGYTAQAIPSMSKADSRIEMTETHKNWISKYVFDRESRSHRGPRSEYFVAVLQTLVLVP